MNVIFGLDLKIYITKDCRIKYGNDTGVKND